MVKLIVNRWVWGWCLILCESRQQARMVTMTTLGAATTRHRHTEKKLSGRQETKYLQVFTWKGKGGWERNSQEKAELAQRQPCSTTTRVKWFDLHGRAVNYWSPWINPKTAPTSGTNHWPANIVSSLTLPKFQLATFNSRSLSRLNNCYCAVIAQTFIS